MIVYLDDEISADEKKQIEKIFSSRSEIDSFDFVSREKAWENFQSMFSEYPIHALMGQKIEKLVLNEKDDILFV